MRILPVALGWVLLSVSGYGADTITPVSLPWSNASAPQPDPVGGLGNVVLTATALVVLVGLGLYFIKNGTLPFRSQGGVERKLHVRETRMLGSRQFLVVVEYEDNKLLLGVTPGKIDYLCALEGRPNASPSFSEVLRSASHQGAPTGGTT